MSMKELNFDNFKKALSSSNKPVLVDFWAEWCGPCRMLLPIVHEIAEEYSGAEFYSVNVDNESELASMYSVMSIPTLIIFKDGEIVHRIEGVQPRQKILELLDSAAK